MKKDKFKELYDYCQTLQLPISRGKIVPKIKNITGINNIQVIKTDLNIDTCRGYFLHSANEDNPFRLTGMHYIVLAKALNPCWARFVSTKELMHLFDEENEATNTKEKFVELLSDFEARRQCPSEQTNSDARALWMALACLCPEHMRLEFKEQLEKGLVDNYKIALQLKIPEQYVPHLFRENFLDTVNRLIK